MGRYPFGVELFHLLLHAGLSRRFHKIEHRLFSRITGNWRGRPLETYQTVVSLIANTTTYPTGVKIPDAQMNALRDTGTLRRHDWHPEWNYTLNPPHD